MATVRERQAVRFLQERVTNLRNDIATSMVVWPFIRYKRIKSWATELNDIILQCGYIANSLMTEEAAQSATGSHHCHDQYCYDNSRHACHQEGCKG